MKSTKKFTKNGTSNQIKHIVKVEDEKFKTIANMNGSSRRIKTILPPISSNSPFIIKRRFVAGAGTSGDILISDLFNAWIVASTAILGHPVCRAARLKKISVLAPVTTNGTTTFLTLTPNGSESTDNNFNSMPEVYVDTSATLDKPAFISLKPSEISPLGSWHVTHQSATPKLLAIVCPTGTVMDLTIEMIPNNNSIVNYTTVLAGATAGASYCRPILTNFIPLGFSSL